jgi:hypothetical protein
MIDRQEIGQVQATMQPRHAFMGQVREHSVLEQIEMEMDDVE